MTRGIQERASGRSCAITSYTTKLWLLPPPSMPPWAHTHASADSAAYAGTSEPHHTLPISL